MRSIDYWCASWQALFESHLKHYYASDKTLCQGGASRGPPATPAIADRLSARPEDKFRNQYAIVLTLRTELAPFFASL
jgi:hypothetical protein